MNIQKLFLATLLLILPIFCFGWGFPTRQKKDETIQPQQNVRSDEIPEEINESGPASPAQIQQTIDKIRKSPEDLKNEKEERKKEGSNPIIELKTKKMKKLFHIFENPDYYHDQGVKIPRGILLVGPPGSGKTTYVKELATRGECWLYSQQAAAIGGSFAQEGVEYLKALCLDAFNHATRKHPAIVFLDEIDLLVRSRDDLGGGSGGVDMSKTLMFLATEIEKDKYEHVIFIGATNRPGDLDAAFKRAGRIDKTIEFEMPNEQELEDAIRQFSIDFPILKGKEPVHLAKKMFNEEFSYAYVKLVLSEAVENALYEGRDTVIQEDYDYAMSCAIKKIKEDRLRGWPHERSELEKDHKCFTTIVGSLPTHDIMAAIQIMKHRGYDGDLIDIVERMGPQTRT